MTRTARLSVDEYFRVQEFLREYRLGFGFHEHPVPLGPVIEWLGWKIIRRADLHALGVSALTATGRRAKILYVDDRMNCATWRTVYAHILGHEALGYIPKVDEIRPAPLLNQRRTPADMVVERAVWGAQAMVIVPEAFVQSHLTIEEIAERCKCTPAAAAMRVSGIVIGDDDHAILRLDRRAPSDVHIRQMRSS